MAAPVDKARWLKGPDRKVTRFGEPGLASAMGTVYLIAMLAVSILAIALIWRPGRSAR